MCSCHSNKIDADRKASLHAHICLCMHGRGITQAHTQTEEKVHTHTQLSKHWLLGREPLWFWLPVKGKQHELLWPKKCIPDQSHMRLALHLYHVSALTHRGLEKFRSAQREMQERTGRTAGVRRWMKNRLIFMVELTSAFFSFFFPKSLPGKYEFHMCSIRVRHLKASAL